jgi:hypothetical protein
VEGFSKYLKVTELIISNGWMVGKVECMSKLLKLLSKAV